MPNSTVRGVDEANRLTFMSTFESLLPESVIEQFDRLILRGQGARFDGHHFRQWCGPLVYMFLLDGKPLYIGMSADGITRPASANHNAMEARNRCNEVLLWPTRTPEDAGHLEALLIHLLYPRHNKRRPELCELGRLMGLAPHSLRDIKKAAFQYRYPEIF